VEQVALQSPEAGFERPPEHNFRTSTVVRNLPPQQPQSSNVRTAINGALRTLLENDPRTVLLGEDLHEPYGGAFKVTAGLSEQFAGRVISTPISEAGITGAGRIDHGDYLRRMAHQHRRMPLTLCYR
jgi:2-oxoisovalerate dehydrogenase E1 component